ncbi:hypothetical protein [Enterococcus rotai]|uniref:hypothetical protein n=1 Tax=Enterococcus rotai TaxID=118060 RepID=UPI0032B56714
MKRNSYSKLIFSLMVLIAFFLGSPSITQAENVQTNGEIIIREKKTKPTTESTTEPIKETNSESDLVKKPVGRLPSTGELVKMSIASSGILLVAGIFLYRIFARKKSKKLQGKEQ